VAERFTGWEDSGLPPSSPGSVVTVGTFDGVHRGHQDVLARIARRGEELRLDSVLVTFEPHPLEVVNPAAAPLLLTVAREKLEVIAESGIGYMAIVPFTRNLQRYRADQFVDEVLRKRFHMRHLVIGHDHGFGRGREGDVEMLRALGAARGFGVEVVEAVSAGDGRPLSSSYIRRAVAGGDLTRAAASLGRLYSVSGEVRGGDKRGTLLGFPTVNLGPPPPSQAAPTRGRVRSAGLVTHWRVRGYDEPRSAPHLRGSGGHPLGASVRRLGGSLRSFDQGGIRGASARYPTVR